MPTNPVGGGEPTALFFETINITAGSITVDAGEPAPEITATIGSTGSCSTYYATYAIDGAWQGASSPGTLSSLTITFPSSTNLNTTTLNSSTSPFYFAFICT